MNIVNEIVSDPEQEAPEKIDEELLDEEFNDEKLHPIAVAIDEFVNSILDIQDCYKRFFPIGVEQIRDELEQIKETLVSLESSDDDDIHALKTMENVWRTAKRLHKSKILETLASSLFINLFSAFDKFTGILIKELYLSKPELFKSLNKEIKLSEVLILDSLDDLKASVLSDDIEQLRRKSYLDQFKELENRFSINLRNFKTWPIFIEAAQRRNLLTHCDGVVSQQYLKTCKEVGYKFSETPQEGERLRVDTEYFFLACFTVGEVGVMLGQTLWRKLIPQDIADADNHLHRLVYQFLEMEEWGPAILLSHFAKNLPKFSEEKIRRINIINHAIALTATGKKSSAIKIIQSEDWSVVTPEFQLAVAVLTEKEGEAISLMKSIGKEGDMLNELAYHEWPLFRDFRKKEVFLDTYAEIYGYPFINKLNELAEESAAESMDESIE